MPAELIVGVVLVVALAGDAGGGDVGGGSNE
jgi:hypothetical protein